MTRFNKPLLIAIDSDGCAFDGLTVKQRQAFIPEAIRVFALEDVAEVYVQCAEEVNLFSHLRGCNRFEALYCSLTLTRRRVNHPLGIPDIEPLEDFVRSQPTLSQDSIEKQIETTGAEVLKLALSWSRDCNEKIATLAATIDPFEGAREFLQAAVAYADIMVCSAATKDALHDEWERVGFDRFVTHIAGQEFGPKDQQIRSAMGKGQFPPSRVLMIGDALGDYRAAKKAGVRFFPILPNQEKTSWAMAKENLLNPFLAESYDEETEAGFLKTLQEALPHCEV